MIAAMPGNWQSCCIGTSWKRFTTTSMACGRCGNWRAPTSPSRGILRGRWLARKLFTGVEGSLVPANRFMHSVIGRNGSQNSPKAACAGGRSSTISSLIHWPHCADKRDRSYLSRAASTPW